MPDTKFSWRGLREHLRKYLWFYLLGIVLGLVGAELLWTMTRPRIPANASVNIYMAAPFSDAEPLQALAPDIQLAQRRAQGHQAFVKAADILHSLHAQPFPALQRHPVPAGRQLLSLCFRHILTPGERVCAGGRNYAWGSDPERGNFRR